MNGPSIEFVSCTAFKTVESRGQHRRRGCVRKRVRRLLGWVRRRSAAGVDSGMSTAEYAVGTVAACGFAALLYKVLTSAAVTDVLTELLTRALHAV